MAFGASSISPNEVDAGGGTRLLITGTFSGYIGTPFVVEFTPDGGGDIALALSGVSGLPTTLFPRNATEMFCYLPELTPDIYDVKVKLLDASEEVDLLAAVTVEKKQFFTKVFDIRSVWPPIYRVGPRNMELLEPVS